MWEVKREEKNFKGLVDNSAILKSKGKSYLPFFFLIESISLNTIPSNLEVFSFISTKNRYILLQNFYY